MELVFLFEVSESSFVETWSDLETEGLLDDPVEGLEVYPRDKELLEDFDPDEEGFSIELEGVLEVELPGFSLVLVEVREEELPGFSSTLS